MAPAVESRDTTHPIQNWMLKVATHMFPSLKLAESCSGMRLSDNLDMLRAHRTDPLAMHETRVDALWGLTNLMDRAMAGAARLPGLTLLLYGEHDEIIPGGAFCVLMGRLPAVSPGHSHCTLSRGLAYADP